ncbi:MAG: helix-turn-helix domain-containing protein [Stenotrophobium sp.]
MSIVAMNWVWGLPKLDPAEKFTLLALADIADDAGRCWPSIERLAVKTCQSARTVQRHLNLHRERSLLLIQSRYRLDGSQTSNLYQLTLMPRGDKLSPQCVNNEVGGCQLSHGGGDATDTQTTNESSKTHKQPQQNLQIESPHIHQVVVDVGKLILPSILKPIERVEALKIVGAVNDAQLAQEVLDEFSGRTARTVVQNPLRYLSVLVARARKGEFTSELGLQVKEQREQRERTAVLVARSAAHAEQAVLQRMNSSIAAPSIMAQRATLLDPLHSIPPSTEKKS